MTTFSELNLSAPLLQALASEGYETPTPIQTQAVPPLLEGRDLLGIAQTGTGKTAAFALPLLQRLTTTDRRAGPRCVRALVLTPTRELCVQILDSFRSYGRHLGLSRAAVFGGVSQGPQVHALSRGVDVLVATPGRLLDLMNQGQVRFDMLEAFVLDEADRMLDMGFIVPVKRIVAKLPKARQTLLFSATMPQAVTGLAASLLKDPVRVEVTPVATTADRISQRVHFVEKANKRALLGHLLGDGAIERALVFTRTKHGANKVADQLGRAGVRADAIHGNKSQNARQKALNDFRNGKIRVLVATDIAARGLDVDGITHVINFDLPNEPESYVHRIGRTARAGNDGVAISFCDAEERVFLRDIERTIRQSVTIDPDHPFHAAHIASGARQSVERRDVGTGERSNDGRRRAGNTRRRHKGTNLAADRANHGHGSDQREPARQPQRNTDKSVDAPWVRRSGTPPKSGGKPASHGPAALAERAESREHRRQHGGPHEVRGKGQGGHRTDSQRRSDVGNQRSERPGDQPLKRTHQQKRSNAKAEGRQAQRFEPVRMR